jgi:hypothetical protein
MSQAVSHRTLATEAHIHALVSLCGIWNGQNRTGTGFPSSSLVPPVSIIPPGLHNHIEFWE